MTEATPPAQGASAGRKLIGDIALAYPLKREEGDLTNIKLFGPCTPELMDSNIYDLMRMKTVELVKVLPRITEPSLFPHEVLTLSGRDLFQFAEPISDFLLN